MLPVSEEHRALDAVDAQPRQSAAWLHWLIGILLLIVLVVFVAATPSGVLSKADMVGYAVCHQIESHSFTIAGHQLPLCARCTGTFLGALVGLLGQAAVLRRRKAALFPSPRILAILVSFTLLWIADGLNSYLALINGPHLYEPRNALRLTTGALNGLTMSALIYPVFNVTVWREPLHEPAFRGLRDLGVALLMEAVLVSLVLSRWGFLLHPLALLSASAVLTLLTSVNTAMTLILFQRENSVKSWQQAIAPISVGLMLSLVQIGLIDILRFRLTGTLEGIPPLQ